MIRLLFLFFALSVNAFALSPLFSQRRCVRLSESSYATASARVQLRESIQEPKRRREVRYILGAAHYYSSLLMVFLYCYLCADY
jgi:hypothetical protein